MHIQDSLNLILQGNVSHPRQLLQNQIQRNESRTLSYPSSSSILSPMCHTFDNGSSIGVTSNMAHNQVSINDTLSHNFMETTNNNLTNNLLISNGFNLSYPNTYVINPFLNLIFDLIRLWSLVISASSNTELLLKL